MLILDICWFKDKASGRVVGKAKALMPAGIKNASQVDDWHLKVGVKTGLAVYRTHGLFDRGEGHMAMTCLLYMLTPPLHHRHPLVKVI